MYIIQSEFIDKSGILHQTAWAQHCTDRHTQRATCIYMTYIKDFVLSVVNDRVLSIFNEFIRVTGRHRSNL